jgi:hypothetical protein
MFELAVLRRTGNDEDIIDVGLLAETLLFYQRVHLVLDSGTLGYLAKTIGPDLLLEVLDRRGVSASFLRESLGTVTSREGGLKLYNFAQFRVDPPGKPGNVQRVMTSGASNDIRTALTQFMASGEVQALSADNRQSPKLGWRHVSANEVAGCTLTLASGAALVAVAVIVEFALR